MLNEFWDRVLGVTELFQEGHASILLRKYSENQFTLKERYKKNLIKRDINNFFDDEIVIVIDEARCLLDERTDVISQFRLLRKAQRELESSSVVLVFIDTTSTISNFSPASSFDSSFRPENRFSLLPPYYEIQTYLSVDIVKALFSAPHRRTFSDEFLAELVIRFCIGRPLWYAYHLKSAKFEHAIIYAAQKLSGSKSYTLKEKSFALLAVFSLRFGAKGILDHTIAVRLISNYMATGIYLGNDRIRMMASYVPEPLLAEAACRLLHQKEQALSFDEIQLCARISEFMNRIVTGFIHVGELGEFICRMILSLTYDAVKLNYWKKKATTIDTTDYFTRPITCRQFLDQLITDEYAEYFKGLESSAFFYSIPDDQDFDLNQAEMVLTSWIFLEDRPYKLDSAYLEKCYLSGVGIVLPYSHRGADLLIPLKVNRMEFSYILIQCKLRDGLSMNQHLVAAGEKLSPVKVFSTYKTVDKKSICSNDYTPPKHYLALYMDIGSELGINESDGSESGSKKQQKGNPKEQTVDEERNQANQREKSEPKIALSDHRSEFPHHIILTGLPFKILQKNKGLLQTIKTFLKKQVDFINVKKRHAVLKKMNPLSFAFTGPRTVEEITAAIDVMQVDESNLVEVGAGSLVEVDGLLLDNSE